MAYFPKTVCLVLQIQYKVMTFTRTRLYCCLPWCLLLLQLQLKIGCMFIAGLLNGAVKYVLHDVVFVFGNHILVKKNCGKYDCISSLYKGNNRN